jgi:hypothetical protein
MYPGTMRSQKLDNWESAERPAKAIRSFQLYQGINSERRSFEVEKSYVSWIEVA